MEKPITEKSALQLSNLTLRHLVEELQFLQNGFVNKVQNINYEGLKFKVHTKQFGDKILIVLPNVLFVAEKSIPAKQNPGGFSAFLNKQIYNQRIINLEQHGMDRIIVIEFPEVFLVLELFAKGNIVLCNKEWTIIRAMRKEAWSDRKLEQAQKYKFPSFKGISPLDAENEEFVKNILENKKTSFGAFIDLLNVNPAILEKVFSDLGIDKKRNANELSRKDVKNIFEKVKEIYLSKSTGAYLSEKVIYSTETGKEKEQFFETINKALNTLFFLNNNETTSTNIQKENPQKDAKNSEKGVLAKLKQIELLEKQEKEVKEKAEQLFLHYAEINAVVKEIKELKKKGLNEKQVLEKLSNKKIVVKSFDSKKEKVVLSA